MPPELSSGFEHLSEVEDQDNLFDDDFKLYDEEPDNEEDDEYEQEQ